MKGYGKKEKSRSLSLSLSLSFVLSFFLFFFSVSLFQSQGRPFSLPYSIVLFSSLSPLLLKELPWEESAGKKEEIWAFGEEERLPATCEGVCVCAWIFIFNTGRDGSESDIERLPLKLFWSFSYFLSRTLIVRRSASKLCKKRHRVFPSYHLFLHFHFLPLTFFLIMINFVFLLILPPLSLIVFIFQAYFRNKDEFYTKMVKSYVLFFLPDHFVYKSSQVR